MRTRGINFKKSYSREFFSLEGKKIFSNFLFFVFLLGVVSTGFIFCQNGICPKKVSSILDNGITGNVVGSEEIEVNSIQRVEISSKYEEYSLGNINAVNQDFDERVYGQNKRADRFLDIKILIIPLMFLFFIILAVILSFFTTKK